MSYKAAKSGLGSKSASKALYRRYKSRRSRNAARCNPAASTDADSSVVDESSYTEIRSEERLATSSDDPSPGLARSSSLDYSTKQPPRAGDVTRSVKSDGLHRAAPGRAGTRSSEGFERSRDPPPTQVYTFVPIRTNGGAMTTDPAYVPSAADIMSSQSAARRYLDVSEKLACSEDIVGAIVEKTVTHNSPSRPLCPLSSLTDAHGIAYFTVWTRLLFNSPRHHALRIKKLHLSNACLGHT